VASGDWSITLGTGYASAVGARAFCSTCLASGESSLVLGQQSIASGRFATAIGISTMARSFAEVTMGYWATDCMPSSTTNVSSGDRLLVLGNGMNNSSRSDALILYKNGNMTIVGTFIQSSDMRLKSEIAPLDISLSDMVKLQGMHYKWNNVKPHDMESLQTGLIAQEVE